MLAKFVLTYANLGRNYLSGSNMFKFFNKEKSNKHKGEGCMKLVTDWNHLLEEITSWGNSGTTENIMRVDLPSCFWIIIVDNRGADMAKA